MTSRDPLLPLPETPINLPAQLDGAERFDEAIRVAVSDANLIAMAWPAKNSEGELVPPPHDHVLHELVHAHHLVDDEKLLASPRLGDVAFLSELPACFVCNSQARYDARVETRGVQVSGYLCGHHYLQIGSGTLGASGDSYLMLYSEVPLEVQRECNNMLAVQGRDPIFEATNIR